MPFHIGENTGCAGGTVGKERAQRNARAACSKHTRCQVQEEGEAEDAKASAEGYTEHIVIINQSASQSVNQSRRLLLIARQTLLRLQALQRERLGEQRLGLRIPAETKSSVFSPNQSNQLLYVALNRSKGTFFAVMRCVEDICV